jgi:hypothetical protein
LSYLVRLNAVAPYPQLATPGFFAPQSGEAAPCERSERDRSEPREAPGSNPRESMAGSRRIEVVR